jgi:phosphoribosylglycinamide formyltransferase-1
MSRNCRLKKIVVLFSGVGSNLEYILRHMHGKELEVVAAITNNPEAGGIAVAGKYGVTTEVIDHRKFGKREDFDKKLLEKIETYRPDLTVLAGFMRRLTPIFTKNVKAINLHPSLLPRHKGLNAIEKSWKDAFCEGGVTVHMVNEELDGGVIICQYIIDKDGMDFEEYKAAVRKVEKDALADAIREVLDISQDCCDINGQI